MNGTPTKEQIEFVTKFLADKKKKPVAVPAKPKKPGYDISCHRCNSIFLSENDGKISKLIKCRIRYDENDVTYVMCPKCKLRNRLGITINQVKESGLAIEADFVRAETCVVTKPIFGRITFSATCGDCGEFFETQEFTLRSRNAVFVNCHYCGKANQTGLVYNG